MMNGMPEGILSSRASAATAWGRGAAVSVMAAAREPTRTWGLSPPHPRPKLLHEREAGAGRERGQMAAFLGDVDVATLVDAEKVGDGVARADRPDGDAIARTDDGNLGMGDEEGAGAEHGLESPRDVGLEDGAEAVPVAERARLRFDGDELTRRCVADEE